MINCAIKSVHEIFMFEIFNKHCFMSSIQLILFITYYIVYLTALMCF